ncbi:MAG: radical SAM protein [Candidatus Brocadiaceae bacterium]|nr:radical SAM protein [Candidatus Brocadiaceae bacterium]
MNKSFCLSCEKLVPTERVDRDGKVYLVKHCPDCGDTETMISNRADRCNAKRELDFDYDYHGCAIQCRQCNLGKAPTYAFINLTNSCNSNCPICLDNVPAMGFRYEPPLEYFDSLFRQLSEMEEPPTIALFGGEPTVRKDLMDIVKLSKSYKLTTRIFTNGQKLADEEYTAELIKNRAIIMMSYDGSNPETYTQLRGTPKVMELKQKAIENIARTRRAKAIMVSVIAHGLNDHLVPELLDLCHRHRHAFRCIYLMPLAHMWKESEWDYSPNRMTTEDAEALVNDAYPEYDIQFIPAGLLSQFRHLTGLIDKASSIYGGAHPNCESVYLLVSNGERWVPIDHYLRGNLHDIARHAIRLEKQFAAREERWQHSALGKLLGWLHLRRFALRTIALPQLFFLIARRVRFGRLFKGWGPVKLYNIVMAGFEKLFGKKTRTIREHRTHWQDTFQVIILPLEDNHVLETERLERCPTVHAYLDPQTGELKYIPVCAWRLHNGPILRELAERYPVGQPA